MVKINCAQCGIELDILEYNFFVACPCGYLNDKSQLDESQSTDTSCSYLQAVTHKGQNVIASYGRKSWDSYFMDIAYMVSTRATCPRRHVGAILTKDKKILGSGYNGAPSGVPSCIDEGCLLQNYSELNEHGFNVIKHKCTRTIHAEQNLLLFTDQNDRNGATMYVTDQPCWTCANMIANSGVIEVVYHRKYEKEYQKVLDLFTAKNITLRELDNYTPPVNTNMTVTD